MNQEKIGSFIAKLRQDRGLTQTELGDKLGVSYKAVSKWERGINLPDAALYKPLCDIFDITIDELMQGELISKNKKSNKLIILVIVILFIVLLVIMFIYKDNNKHPKISINNIEIIKNNDNKLVNQLLYTNDNIWYYSLDEVKICTNIKTCYNLGIALNHKQITIDEIKEYFQNQYIFNNIKKTIIRDGGTTIYENNEYSVIFCNTLSGNKDIYFGPGDLQTKLNNNFCSHDPNKIKYFTKTYRVLNIYPDDDEDYMNITISQFQNGVATVRVDKTNELEVGKDYEFTFYTYKVFDETIENIFKYAILANTKETNKIGLEQIQESIYITKDK